jgi:glutathione S-transferase
MDSTSLVLHHYEDSPYAEKIRLMFGYLNLSWCSLLSPAMPPRPHLDPLVGGYRRIPVLQQGADLFCDTALIANELAAQTDRPSLRVDSPEAPAAALVARAQGDVFFSVITSQPPLKLLKGLVSRFGLRDTYRFFKDRTRMMKTATIRPPRGERAAQVIEQFFQDLNQHLAHSQFLTGAAPGYADFAVIHPTTFYLSISGAPISDTQPHLQRWVQEMVSFGHGDRQEATADAVFAMARDAQPRELPPGDENALIGRLVSVAPGDYGQVPVSGTLVCVNEERIIVARETESFGALHVHFPRAGYTLSAA